MAVLLFVQHNCNLWKNLLVKSKRYSFLNTSSFCLYSYRFTKVLPGKYDVKALSGATQKYRFEKVSFGLLAIVIQISKSCISMLLFCEKIIDFWFFVILS